MWTLRSIVLLINVVISRVTAFTGSEKLFHDTTTKDYKVYWNVPTFMCKKYNISFVNVSRDFGIVQNEGDDFVGNEIAFLYDLGMLPAMLKRPDGTIQLRNGAVPQAGNLTKHLELFKRHLVEQIPDRNFRGLGIIHFDKWLPIFDQNFGNLKLYRSLSLRLENNKNPLENEYFHKSEAKKNFENFAKAFMEETLKTAIALRPRANWGYYGYPYCFNFSPQNPYANCDPRITSANDEMSWLFNAQKSLFPSVYMAKSPLDKNQMNRLIYRIDEAVRISKKSTPRKKVLAYVEYKYFTTKYFVYSKTLADGFRKIFETGADGYVIAAGLEDFKTAEKCLNFQYYLNNYLGPTVVESIKWAKLNL